MIEKLIKNLESLNYNFKIIDEDTVKVYLTNALVVTVKNVKNNWIIEEKFESLNFITTFLKIGFSDALIVNVVFSILAIIIGTTIGAYLHITYFVMIVILLAWVIYFYYYIKFLAFKVFLNNMIIGFEK